MEETRRDRVKKLVTALFLFPASILFATFWPSWVWIFLKGGDALVLHIILSFIGPLIVYGIYCLIGRTQGGIDMNYIPEGNCKKCGAPYYSSTVWHGITPPPLAPSCNCWHSDTTFSPGSCGPRKLSSKKSESPEPDRQTAGTELCPFCGEDACMPREDGKWGYILCCACYARGPEVRTGYEPISAWKHRAYKEWNKRLKKAKNEKGL